MKRENSLYYIKSEIERVKLVDSFKGKAELLKRLVHIYDLIGLYKPTPEFYDILVNEANSLLSKLQFDLDIKAKGG